MERQEDGFRFVHVNAGIIWVLPHFPVCRPEPYPVPRRGMRSLAPNL